MGKLPSTHGIDAVHLAQWEMTADYSAIPLSMSVLPHFSKKKQKKNCNLSIHQERKQGNRESDRHTGNEQERKQSASE